MKKRTKQNNAIVMHTNANMDVVLVTACVSDFALATVDREIFVDKMFSETTEYQVLLHVEDCDEYHVTVSRLVILWLFCLSLLVILKELGSGGV